MVTPHQKYFIIDCLEAKKVQPLLNTILVQSFDDNLANLGRNLRVASNLDKFIAEVLSITISLLRYLLRLALSP